MSKRIRAYHDAPVPPGRMFAVLTDWSRHHEWMIATDARLSPGSENGVGAHLSAFTGLGPLGFTDSMEITAWDPPHLVAVNHTGHLVRGTGRFHITPHENGCRIEWEEDLDLPPGVPLVWPLLRPAAEAFFTLSLRRLAHLAAEPVTPS